MLIKRYFKKISRKIIRRILTHARLLEKTYGGGLSRIYFNSYVEFFKKNNNPRDLQSYTYFFQDWRKRLLFLLLISPNKKDFKCLRGPSKLSSPAPNEIIFYVSVLRKFIFKFLIKISNIEYELKFLTQKNLETHQMPLAVGYFRSLLDGRLYYAIKSDYDLTFVIWNALNFSYLLAFRYYFIGLISYFRIEKNLREKFKLWKYLFSPISIIHFALICKDKIDRPLIYFNTFLMRPHLGSIVDESNEILGFYSRSDFNHSVHLRLNERWVSFPGTKPPTFYRRAIYWDKGHQSNICEMCLNTKNIVYSKPVSFDMDLQSPIELTKNGEFLCVFDFRPRRKTYHLGYDLGVRFTIYEYKKFVLWAMKIAKKRGLSVVVKRKREIGTEHKSIEPLLDQYSREGLIRVCDVLPSDINISMVVVYRDSTPHRFFGEGTICYL